MAVSVLDTNTFTVDSDPTGSPTISSGSNRCAILYLLAEVASATDLVVSTMTIGGQTYTQAYEYYNEDGADDAAVYLYLWDESAIAAMSGTSISYSDNRVLNKRGFGFITYQDVNQTTFPKTQGQATGSGTTTRDVTTTSVTGDRIFVASLGKNAARTYDDWDTCTELVDQADGGSLCRFGAAEGDGGDNTTTVTVSSAMYYSVNAVVLGAESDVDTPLSAGGMIVNP